MEGFGFRNICIALSNFGILIGIYVHDGDGTTFKIILEYWPNAQEHRDPGMIMVIYFDFYLFHYSGHFRKNFKKKLLTLAKTFPELKGLGLTDN